MLPKRKLSNSHFRDIKRALKVRRQILQKTPTQTANAFLSPIIFISKTLDAIILIYCNIMIFLKTNILDKKTFMHQKGNILLLFCFGFYHLFHNSRNISLWKCSIASFCRTMKSTKHFCERSYRRKIYLWINKKEEKTSRWSCKCS